MDAALQKELLAVRVMIAKSDPITPSLGLPNGTHNCMPDSITIGKAGKNKDGRLQVVIAWKCVEGNNKDKIHMDWGNGLEEQSTGYTKGKLLTMISDLPKDVLKWQDVFDDFCQNNTDVFEITVSTNEKGYKNVLIGGLANSSSAELGEEVEGLEEASTEKDGLETEDVFGESDDLDFEEPKAKKAKPAQKAVGRK